MSTVTSISKEGGVALGGSLTLRRATVQDVPVMAGIINGYAAQGLMLPRSHHKLYQYLRDFLLAIVDGEIVGCGSLHIVWEDLAEVRSLALQQGWTGKGIGRALVEALLLDARELGLPGVFTLTYQQAFFERLGFHVAPRESLPHKIWGECLDCPKFTNCDEIAMVLSFEQQEENDG